MRLIDADALIQEADKAFEHIDSPLLNHITTYDVYSLINNAPTIKERPHGEWIDGYCSKCGGMSFCDGWGRDLESKFCPNCGADMRKEANNEC